MREVGDVEERRLDLLVEGLEPLVETGDLVADLSHVGDDGRGVLSRLLQPGDLFGGLVLVGPEVLGLLEDVLLLPGDADEFVEAYPRAPRRKPILNRFKVFQDEFRVEHGPIIAWTTGICR